MAPLQERGQPSEGSEALCISTTASHRRLSEAVNNIKGILIRKISIPAPCLLSGFLTGCLLKEDSAEASVMLLLLNWMRGDQG